MSAVASAEPAALDLFVGKMLADIGAAMAGATVMMGDHLGFYRALKEAGPLDAATLARLTNTSPRLVAEWLAAQASSGYVQFDPGSGRFSLSPEQAMVFAEEDSPVYMMGAFGIAASTWRDEPRIAEGYRSGRGLGWHERDNCLFCATERFFRPSYQHNLVQSWLPALDGVVAKLEAGASVADVGCGHGASTLIMARAYPKSRFTGFDYHPASVAAAREQTAREGLSDRVTFEVGAAQQVPARAFDLACCFDCLHDMGDPKGAAASLHGALKPDGTLMVVEPMAHDSLADNLNPVGRVYYAASAMICTPASLNQPGQAGLGAQAGPRRLSEVIREGGFRTVRVAAETPFNMVLEARP
ncbi:methyltransferase domain-containing protein [Roseomonas terrae]|jgi:SAM-dependent methyltransferase|uniref:Methyltransferase domain-containing protein n=1 Tax=Neoroseomonas terrae TaxID=424799 RepID=A0ABS5EN35_9PROT|nr:methyltransferase domain-containing protein [Neoroseomonas terrae]MBR0652435.1 methyltransferase domain-containing protein [Neoroseomonas terrae]